MYTKKQLNAPKSNVYALLAVKLNMKCIFSINGSNMSRYNSSQTTGELYQLVRKAFWNLTMLFYIDNKQDELAQYVFSVTTLMCKRFTLGMFLFTTFVSHNPMRFMESERIQTRGLAIWHV